MRALPNLQISIALLVDGTLLHTMEPQIGFFQASKLPRRMLPIVELGMFKPIGC